MTRKTGDGAVLRRPGRIEAEIAETLGLTTREILTRAARPPESADEMSDECMVYLIRRSLRHGSRHLAESLMPALLERCAASLRGSVRGFAPAAAGEVREEILGRLAVSLAEPGDEADFLEVRFAFALKRLRIDVCRQQRRRDRGRITLDDPAATDGDAQPASAQLDRAAPPVAAGQEDLVLIRQALEALTEDERKVLVLHKLAGISLCSRAEGGADLVRLLGRSERTLRNRLRSAEAKLRAFQEAS